MGVHCLGPGTRSGSGPALTATTVARVVPDIPTFSLDRGFLYRIPRELVEQVAVGSLVRVPLAGRRVRGYVVDLVRPAENAGEGLPPRLKDIRTVSSVIPVFTEAMAPALRWAASHYVAPLAAVLARTGPPNLPKPPPARSLPGVPPAGGMVPEVSKAAAAGGAPRTVQLIAGSDWGGSIRGIISAPVRADKSVLVVAPTAVEASRLGERLADDFGRRLVVVADLEDAAVTSAWSLAATHAGLVVVGTLRVGWWPVRRLSMIVLVDDGRRGMKERRTPTVAVRDLASARSAAEGLQLVLLGRVPTVRTLHDGLEIFRVPGRLWAPVEMVDRGEDPPGGGVLAARVKPAIAATIKRGGRVLAFTHRRGYAPAARCGRCRELRICPDCGARPDHRKTCPRCEAALGACISCGGTRFEPLGAAVGRVTEELGRLVGDRVGAVGSGSPVMVGTERDLVIAPPVDLAVVVDADGLVRGTNYRATEDALALLARVAATVRMRPGCRLMLQTADPGHPVYRALRRSDPLPFLADELAARRRFSLPPCGEVMVVEVAGSDDMSILDRALEGATVFGPAPAAGGIRWMVQGRDLDGVKGRLRSTVGRLRERDCQVRIDVDPREF